MRSVNPRSPFHGPVWSRRQALRAAALGLSGISAAYTFSGQVEAEPSACRDDIAVDDATALVYPEEAPLAPIKGLRDARAVWCHVPARTDRSVLVFLHGYDGYVTVDASGRSRVPDWAASDDKARAVQGPSKRPP